MYIHMSLFWSSQTTYETLWGPWIFNLSVPLHGYHYHASVPPSICPSFRLSRLSFHLSILPPGLPSVLSLIHPSSCPSFRLSSVWHPRWISSWKFRRRMSMIECEEMRKPFKRNKPDSFFSILCFFRIGFQYLGKFAREKVFTSLSVLSLVGPKYVGLLTSYIIIRPSDLRRSANEVCFAFWRAEK